MTRFILLLTAVIACSCSHLDYNRFTPVASVDPQKADYVDALLRRHGIHSFTEGSVVYGVFVAPENRERTLRILREDSQKEHYQVWY